VVRADPPGAIFCGRKATLIKFDKRYQMAPRANWKGYLRLSAVSCPIALYPASSLSEKVSFNRINRKTGNRLKQFVSRDGMVRGYEVATGQYAGVVARPVVSSAASSTSAWRMLVTIRRYC
jgi:non-homologous end joining protein Ku